MEFADLIKISRVDNVRLRRAGELCHGCDATVAITGHHLILSLEEEEGEDGSQEREVWLLHRMLLSVTKDHESQARSGTLTLRYKTLRTFYLDIIGADKFQLLQTTLENLMNADNPTSSYSFFYNPGVFQALEDGWSLYTPDQEFLSVTRSQPDWRLTSVNVGHTLCSTYPDTVCVPTSISDTQLEACAKFRQHARFPTLSYLFKNIPLVRASHIVSPRPRRCVEDEKMMAAILGHRPRGFILNIKTRSEVNGSGPPVVERDYGYPGWKRVAQLLPALSDLRDSMTSLGSACLEVNNDKWMGRLAGSRWLTHVKDVLNCACLVAQCMERSEAPVLLTELTGRDLSCAVSSLAQIILNPDTRTLHGFEALVCREWLQAGHPFWSRHSSTNTAPVFLVFLDCVHQIYTQFPCSFEFTESLLILLSDHSFASNFGTFLCDSEMERREVGLREHTISLWSYLNQVEILSQHLNCLYFPNKVYTTMINDHHISLTYLFIIRM